MILRMFLVVMATLSLGGCMEFSEEIWINADGSGRVKVDIGLSQAIAAMAMSKGGGEGFCSPEEVSKEKHPNVVSQETQVRNEGEMVHCVIDTHVKDFREIAEVQTMPMDDGDDKLDSVFVIEDLGDGVARFRHRMVPKEKKEEKKKEALKGTKEAMDAMMAKAFEGRYITITLHAPAIHSNQGGEVNPEGTTVSWKMPFYDLVANDRALDAQAEVKYAFTTWEKMKRYFQ